MKRSDLIIYWRLMAVELENDYLSLRNANGTAALYVREMKTAITRLEEAEKYGRQTGNWMFFVNALEQVQDAANKAASTLADKMVDDGVRGVERVLQGTYAAFSFGGRWKEVVALDATRSQIERAIENYRFGRLKRRKKELTVRDWTARTVRQDWKELERDILNLIRQGKNPEQITRTWREYYGQARRDLVTLGLSYNAAVTTDARHDFYARNRQLIQEYEWTAALEQGNVETGRGTCPRCAALDGQRWEKRSSAPPIPLHMRCRCVLLPVTVPPTGLSKQDWEEAEKEARQELERVWGKTRPTKATTGVPSYIWTNRDFSAWWRSQDKEWQDQAIGPRRAALVRAGKIGFKDLVDDKWNLTPVKELEERE